MGNGMRKVEKEMFHVVPRAAQGLLGYQTASRMNLIYLNTVNQVQDDETFPRIPNLCVKLKTDPSVVPVRNCSYKIPWALQKSTQEKLDKLERQGIIEPAPANTPWMSKLRSVAKGTNAAKDKNKEPERRLVINMRAVNEAIMRENHPMPYLENKLPMLSGAMIFTKLDLSSAFHHVELHPDSRDLTCFMTAKGPMRFTRLPFGINAAPEIFQKTMESILDGTEGNIVYMDDILIFAPTEQELERRTAKVLERLKENNLTINQEKSEYRKKTITFLGHEISGNGIKPTVDKIQAIMNFRLPKNKSELRSFLGLVTYIGAAVKNLSDRTTSLRQMLKKSARLEWNKHQTDAFNELKTYISSEVMERGFFQEKAETRLYTDASPSALGAVLVQLQLNRESDKLEERVILCISKSLTDTEQRYPQTHKEALAIVWAVEKLHYYLLGRQFVIYTDHEPLEFVFKRKNVSDKRAMTRAEGWALRLSIYNFTLRHVASGENIADSLSRICDQKDEPYEENYDEYGLFAVETSYEHLQYEWNRSRISEENIKAETETDEESKEIIHAISTNKWTGIGMKDYYQISDELTFIDGTIRRGTKIVLPSSLRKIALEAAHQGHVGASSVKRHLRAHFWWPKMDIDVETLRATCETCTLMQKDGPPAPMTRTKLPTRAWDYVAVDYYSSDEPVPVKILVLQDYFTKFVKSTFVKSTDAKEATNFLSKAFEDEGIPSKIISDNGPPFQSEEFSNWCKARQMRITKSTPALPRANGMVESFMKQLTRALRALKLNDNFNHLTVREAVKNMTFLYNRRPHSQTNRTPFSLLRGREPTDIFPSFQTYEPLSEELRNTIADKQMKGKIYSDSYNHAKEVSIEIGDEVAIKNISKRKLDSNFKPIWFKVINKNGSELTLEHDGKLIKRNSNQVAKRPKFPQPTQSTSSSHSQAAKISAKKGEETSTPVELSPPSPVEPASPRANVTPASEQRSKRERRPNPKYQGGDNVRLINDSEHKEY